MTEKLNLPMSKKKSSDIKEGFKIFINKKNSLLCKELDDFFVDLDTLDVKQILGEWRIGYFFTKDGTGSKLETLMRISPVLPYSKSFLSKNYVKAMIFRFFQMKFNIPITNASLGLINFRNKKSTSMIYNHFPMIDHFRKVDNDTIMGIMEIKGKTSVYFYLERIVD